MAFVTMQTVGLQEVVTSLAGKIKAIDGATPGGLLAGGLIVQREAQAHVPVEYGHLRGSAYTRKTPENDHVVEVGFSADYALYVHENLEKHAGEPRRSGLGVLWGPDGEPKFLEKAVSTKSDDIVEAVRVRAEMAINE